MVTFSRVGLKGEVGSVLVGSVVPQGELNCTTVDTGAQAVGTGKAVKPGDSTEDLTRDGARAPRVGVALVQEHGIARAAAVGHLKTNAQGMRWCDIYGGGEDTTHRDCVALSGGETNKCSEGSDSGEELHVVYVFGIGGE